MPKCFARINPLNYRVNNVVVANDEWIELQPDKDLYIETSQYTFGGVYYDPESGEPAEDQTLALRYNYASPGMIYDVEKDGFYKQQPFPSWILDDTTLIWKPPVERPGSALDYRWDEETLQWINTVPMDDQV